MITMQNVLSALHMASISELIYYVVLTAASLALPFLLGYLFGVIMTHREAHEEEADRLAVEWERRREHNSYVCDMLRQIEKLE